MLIKEKLSLIGSNSPCARVQPLPAAPGDALHPTALRPGVSPQSHHDKCFIKASRKGSKHSSLTSCATRSSSWASSTPNARLYTLKSEVSNRPCMMNVSAFAMAAMTQRTEKSHHDQAAMKCYNLNLLDVDIVPRLKPYLHHAMPMQLVTEAHGHGTLHFGIKLFLHVGIADSFKLLLHGQVRKQTAAAFAGIYVTIYQYPVFIPLSLHQIFIWKTHLNHVPLS